MLAKSRLVTLTGSGGVGKTRLACRVGSELDRAFRDGVWFVELASLTDQDLLADTVISIVGQASRSLTADRGADVAGTLAARSGLLILDNCEHVVDACALLVDEIIATCPHIRVLTTSREPLGVAGESILPVAELTVPPHSLHSDANVAAYESVKLFTDRARSVNPNFVLDEGNSAAVAAICQRLDGIPLALELAAVRLRALSPAELHDRLEDHLHLLDAGNRTSPDRQRTLRASIEWSYDLCTSAERQMWAQLSIFAGGFELDAMESICGGDPAHPNPLGTLLSLVDKSIVTCTQTSGRTRYRMLEVIRRYGADILARSDRDTLMPRRHRDFYAKLAAQSESQWISHQQRQWIDRMSREHANIRVALEYCVTEPGEADSGLEIAGALREWWITLGAASEGIHWFERLLGAHSGSRLTRIRALRTAATLALIMRDLPLAKRWIKEGRELSLGADRRTAALMAQVAGLYALHRGDLQSAITECATALASFRSTGDRDRELGCLVLLQLAYTNSGQHDLALDTHSACMKLADELGDQWYRSYSVMLAGIPHIHSGASERAVAILRESLDLKRSLGDEVGVALCVESLGQATASLDPERAASLLGVAATRWRAMGNMVSAMPDFTSIADTENDLRRRLGKQQFELRYEAGAELEADEALDLALDKKRSSRTRQPAATPLTQRQGEVAALVARGLSNREIADSLVISQRTAETHVEHILTKLGFHSRVQIAAWMGEQNL